MINEIPLNELKQKIIQNFDELELLEVLNLTVEELVDLLEDQIENNYDELLAKLPDDDNDDYSM